MAEPRQLSRAPDRCLQGCPSYNHTETSLGNFGQAWLLSGPTLCGLMRFGTVALVRRANVDESTFLNVALGATSMAVWRRP